jgi:hypothetical protein
MDRVTVVEHVYHRRDGAGPVEAPPTRFWRALRTSSQPYQRSLVADESWRKLELGWVPDPGLLILYNLEGKYLQANPTDEERDDIARRILEVSYAGHERGFLVPAGESTRMCPTHAADLMVRSRHGTIRYQVFAVPP